MAKGGKPKPPPKDEPKAADKWKADKVQINVWIPKDLHDAVKEYREAHPLNPDLTKVVAAALRFYLASEREKARE